uniref:Thioredoxin domain-containing protein n=1 Tax=Gadus morhua TaxID=8049 RepID=A0A8C5BWN7_GADMO
MLGCDPAGQGVFINGVISDRAYKFQAALAEAGDNLVVVDFTASWCGPCKVIGPKFVAMAALPENRNVVFLKVDVDEAADVAAHYEVNCMPTFLFFKNGEKIDNFAGANHILLEQKVVAMR